MGSLPCPRGVLLKQFSQGKRKFSKMVNKCIIILHQTKKTSQLRHIGGSGPLSDSINLSRVHSHTKGGQQVPKVINFFGSKQTFRPLTIELVFSQYGQDNSQMFQVLTHRFRINQDIIKVDQNEPIQVGGQDTIHHRLECSRSIG